MDESAELAELEGLLQECRSLHANLSEHNARMVGEWPGVSDPIHLFPDKGLETPHSIREFVDSAPNPTEFGATLRTLQKQFLYAWRSFLKVNVELENAHHQRACEQSELARLSEQVMLLSQSRAEAAEEKNRLRRDLELRTVENTESRDTIQRLQTQLALRDKDLNALAAELALHERERHAIEEREKSLTEALEALEKVKSDMEGRLEDLEREIEGLRSRLDPIEAELDTARARVGELESELRSSCEEVESLRAEKDALQAKLGLSEANQTEILKMEAKLTASLTDLESYREQFNRLERENAKLKDSLALAEDRLSEREADPAKSEPSNPLETADRTWTDLGSSGAEAFVPLPSPSLDTTSPETIEAGAIASRLAESERGAAPPVSPIPEVTREGLERLAGKRVLLIGGDIRFQADYEHLFQVGDAEVDYFPSIIHLEKHGMKDSVRECDLVVAFGGATQEPGLLRLRKICSDYGRYLLEHPSSGLVSLSHKLKQAVSEL